MSSKSRNEEKRRENDAAYEREIEARNKELREFTEQFGGLLDRFEELGIDVEKLNEYIAYVQDKHSNSYGTSSNNDFTTSSS